MCCMCIATAVSALTWSTSTAVSRPDISTGHWSHIAGIVWGKTMCRAMYMLRVCIGYQLEGRRLDKLCSDTVQVQRCLQRLV